MKTLTIIAICISVLSLVSGIGALTVLILMPDIRELNDNILVSSLLQSITAIFIILLASFWFNQKLNRKYLIYLIILISLNFVDILHSLIAYSDQAYAIGVGFFRIIPLCILIYATLKLSADDRNEKRAKS